VIRINIPSNASHLGAVTAKTSLNSGRHDTEIILVDSPVEPNDLDVFFAASLNDLESRLNCCDAFFVVAAGWVDEVVLHVDNE